MALDIQNSQLNENNKIKVKLCLFISILIIVCCLVAIGLSSYFYESKYEVGKDDYAIVFDAGSSGTRMYVYKWKAGFSASRGDPLIVTEFDNCIANNSGIDKIRTKDEIISSFSGCISRADRKIPNDRKSRTYITLAATAGMRLLEVKNKTQSNLVLQYIREYFSNTSFLFKNDSQVKIISGQDEGTNAWLSVNYFLNKFKPNANPLETIGTLDLGGASTQIVYITNPDVSQNSTETQPFFSNIRIYGINYRPYSYSYLCWGNNEAIRMYRSYVFKIANYSVNTSVSCLPKNYLYSTDKSYLLDSPCTNGMMFNSSVYNFTTNPSDLSNIAQLNASGSSDYNLCKSQVDIILPQITCSFNKCAFNGVYQPSIDNIKFSAFSSYFYAKSNTQSLLNITLSNDINDFINATKTICTYDINQLRDLNSKTAKISDSNLLNICFSNTYVIALLKSLGFNNLANVDISQNINGYSIGWTLGYLINELNRDDFLPFEAPILNRRLPLEGFLPIIICSSVVFLITIAVFILVIIRLTRSTN